MSDLFKVNVAGDRRVSRGFNDCGLSTGTLVPESKAVGPFWKSSGVSKPTFFRKNRGTTLPQGKSSYIHTTGSGGQEVLRIFDPVYSLL